MVGFNVLFFSAVITSIIILILLTFLEKWLNPYFDWNPFDIDRWIVTIYVSVIGSIFGVILVGGNIFYGVYTLVKLFV